MEDIIKLNLKRFANLSLLVLSIFSVISAVLFGYYANGGGNAFVYVSITFFAFSFISAIYEFFVYKTRTSTVRITVSIIFILVALIMAFAPTVEPADHPI